MKNHKIRGLWIGILLLLLVKWGIRQWAKTSPQWIETVYSRGFYPLFSNLLTKVANLFPFSIGEIWIGFCVVLILVTLIRILYGLIKKRYKDAFLLFSKAVLGIVVLLIYLDTSWLMNNYRLQVDEALGFHTEKTSVEDLAATYQILVDKTNALKEESMKEETPSLKTILNTASEGYGNLHQQYAFISGNPVRVKGLLFSWLQTQSGYTGMYLFFAGEPTINNQPPLFSLPFTASHEIAHQKGFAYEDEANYIGFLACKVHPSAYFRYSAYLEASLYVGNALYHQDKDLYREIASGIDPEVVKDIMENQDFWDRNKNDTAEKVVDHLNDSYLKSYNQEEGLKSYGLFVDLLIADYLDDKDL